MPRVYQSKSGPGGRPPTDDRPLARGILFALRIMGRDEGDMVKAATAMLIVARAADAVRAQAEGRRKALIGHESARRRVKDVVAVVLAEQRDNRLTGLPTDLRRGGRLLAALARRDGYAAARAALVGAIAHGLAWDGQVSDPEVRRECIMVAEAWVGSVEAALPKR